MIRDTTVARASALLAANAFVLLQVMDELVKEGFKLASAEPFIIAPSLLGLGGAYLMFSTDDPARRTAEEAIAIIGVLAGLGLWLVTNGAH